METRAEDTAGGVYIVTILSSLALFSLRHSALTLIFFLLLVVLVISLARRGLLKISYPLPGFLKRNILPLLTLGAVALVTEGKGGLGWLEGLYLIPAGGAVLNLGRKGGLPFLGLALLLLFWPWPPQTGSLVYMCLLILNWWMLGCWAEAQAKERERLWRLANRDGLTGLFNHRYFQEKLEENLQEARGKGQNLSLVIFDLDDFKIYNDAFGHQQGDGILKAVSSMLEGSVKPPAFGARYGGEEFAMVLPGLNASAALQVAEHLRQQVEQSRFPGAEVQPSGRVTISAGISSFPDLAESRDELVRLADLALYRVKFVSKNRSEIYFSLLDGLEESLGGKERDLVNSLRVILNLINAKDHYSYGHSERVATYTGRLAERMGLEGREKQLLGYAAFLHDLGKIEVPREILVKPGTLTPVEWEVLQGHSLWGAEIVSPLSTLEGVGQAILHHHENFDGSGYPDGLAGKDIPFWSRIIRIIDSFDDMTSSRPYRSPLTLREAIDQMRLQACKAYDPELVRIFADLTLDNAS